MYIYLHESSEGKNMMFYGHLDKQPHGEGWESPKHPTEPVTIGEWMYGRGSSDDGYAAFTVLLGMKIAQLQGKKLPRICLVLETEEESGSDNLLYLLDKAKDLIKVPDYCFCMDSGCMDYDSLWMTSSLRGVVVLDLKIEASKMAYHSGEAGGVLPETFSILRTLLSRLDDPETGKVHEDFQPKSLPAYKEEEARNLVASHGKTIYDRFDVHEGVKYMHQEDLIEMYNENTWRPNLAITGIEGIPNLTNAGNVVRPSTSVRLSMRQSPITDAEEMKKILIEKVTTNVPYGAKVTILSALSGSGWCMKELDEKILETLNKAGHHFFEGRKAASYGEGGAIPFLKELEGVYPST